MLQMQIIDPKSSSNSKPLSFDCRERALAIIQYPIQWNSLLKTTYLLKTINNAMYVCVYARAQEMNTAREQCNCADIVNKYWIARTHIQTHEQNNNNNK